MDNEGHILDSSNYGIEYVDVFYNGITIVSKQKYEGTSIACARISALIADAAVYKKHNLNVPRF